MSAAVRWAMAAWVLALLWLVSARLGEAAPPVSARDRAFLVAAHQSNLAAIGAGQAARQKASATGIRALAGRLVADHHSLDAELQDVAGRLGVTLPDRPAAGQQRQLSQLAARSGASFDHAWIASQIAGGQQAIAAGQAALSGGGSAKVTELAKSAAPVLQQHLSMLQQLSGGRGDTGTAAGASGPTSQSGWARPATRILTVLGLVLIAFAALFPGRSVPGAPRLAGPPRPGHPPLPRQPGRQPTGPMPAAARAAADPAPSDGPPRRQPAGPMPAAALPVGAAASQRGACQAVATREPAPCYPTTWRYLAR